MKNNYFIKTFLVVFGTFIAALGIYLNLLANKGVDCISTFVAGLNNLLPFLKFGYVSQIFNISMVILALILDRKKIGVGSILSALLLGISIEFFNFIQLANYIHVHPIVLTIIASIITGLGLGICLSGNFGCSPLEAVMMIICENTKISIKYIRMIIDTTALIFGIIFGATFGIGTVISIFLIGPSIEVAINLFKKLNIT